MNTPLLVAADVVEKLILLILIGLSFWSVSVIIDRRRKFLSEKNNSDQGLLGSIKKLCQRFSRPETKSTFEHQFIAEVKQHRLRLEQGLSVLATLGANAPFIGLLGTVLGIIRAFAYLGNQTGSQAVMSGVSQALIATAVGLVVAIPAVIAFNYFSKELKNLVVAAEILKEQHLATLESENHGRK